MAILLLKFREYSFESFFDLFKLDISLLGLNLANSLFILVKLGLELLSLLVLDNLLKVLVQERFHVLRITKFSVFRKFCYPKGKVVHLNRFLLEAIDIKVLTLLGQLEENNENDHHQDV